MPSAAGGCHGGGKTSPSGEYDGGWHQEAPVLPLLDSGGSQVLHPQGQNHSDAERTENCIQLHEPIVCGMEVLDADQDRDGAGGTGDYRTVQ